MVPYRFDSCKGACSSRDLADRGSVIHRAFKETPGRGEGGGGVCAGPAADRRGGPGVGSEKESAHADQHSGRTKAKVQALR